MDNNQIPDNEKDSDIKLNSEEQHNTNDQNPEITNNQSTDQTKDNIINSNSSPEEQHNTNNQNQEITNNQSTDQTKDNITKSNSNEQNNNTNDQNQEITNNQSTDQTKDNITKSNSNEQHNSNDQNPKIFKKIIYKNNLPIKPIIGIIAAILIIILVYSFIGKPITNSITTTTISNVVSTTTIPITIKKIEFQQINSCRTLSKPGKYIVSNSIRTINENESCININSDNVTISCNNLSIIGSGPFINNPPFTYGINITNKTNITISDCIIKSFSYGVFSSNSKNISIMHNNISNNFISNLALINSHEVKVLNNSFFKSETSKGAIYLANNSSDILVKDNFILYNAFLGINVSSSKNQFINNYINNTPLSFYCSLNNSFPISSTAKLGVCYNNTDCGFTSCKGFNTVSNLSSINLSNKMNIKNEINECGSINKQGVYTLQSNINISNFVNSSNPLVNSSQLKCININSNNVTINCNNFDILNAPIGIYANNKNNISLKNCGIKKSNIAIDFKNIISGNLTNIKISHSNMSFNINNSYSIFISDLNLVHNNYGIYLLNSRAISINKFNLSNNTYGLYLNKSFGNIFTNGTIFNNSKVDVYATDGANKTSANLMQFVRCGITDANWATCNLHLSASLAYFPINKCGIISHSGNYSLINNIITPKSNCIDINTNNVKLSCSKYSITGSSKLVGSDAISINNKTNVSINSCDIIGFNSGINVKNSSQIELTNLSIKSLLFGILLNNIKESYIIKNRISGGSNTSILLNNVMNSSIINNNVSYGLSKNIGIFIENSTNNIIKNNKGFNNNIGIYLESKSNNNYIENNIMESNQYTDYLCSSNNSGLNAEINGINYGNIKTDCHWLVALSQLNPNINCPFVSSTSLYSLSHDFIYPYGSTCYQISKSNDSTINCNGHTIIATKGGIFANLKNASNIIIKNCYLKGFTNPIFAQNSSIKVINNTFYVNKSNISAINISLSSHIEINKNNISGYFIGILFTKNQDSFIENNKINAMYSYIINKSVAIKITNNTSNNQSLVGFKLLNSTANSFKNNSFFGIIGLSCLFKSQNSSSNLDLGNNKCSINDNCSWIAGSSVTCN